MPCVILLMTGHRRPSCDDQSEERVNSEAFFTQEKSYAINEQIESMQANQSIVARQGLSRFVRRIHFERMPMLRAKDNFDISTKYLNKL